MADTDDSIALGTRNRNPISFSTTPTAAATSSPRLFATMVMTRNDTCMSPSWNAMGTPTFRMPPSVGP